MDCECADKSRENVEGKMTPRQKEVYMVIDEWWKMYGYGPSIDEVMYQLNVKGRGSVHRMINRLVELGHLKKLPDKARTARPKGVRMYL
jgi:SOS-response transcriptional repressor LexA